MQTLKRLYLENGASEAKKELNLDPSGTKTIAIDNWGGVTNKQIIT